MFTSETEWLHDLRLPLQLIASSAQMLRLSQEDATVDAGRYIDLLLDGVGQMQRMLNGALESQRRVPTPRMCAADLAASVRALCQRCRPGAEARGVELSCGGNVDALRMALDEDLLARILLNLISNALRFTPRGGHVRVEWRALGDFAEVSVSDTGAGIPPERLPLIFLPGVTDGGYGYGLPIARSCAAAMGGELTAQSRPGQGSAFTLRLPVRAVRAG